MMKIDLEQILLDKAIAQGKAFKATLELTPMCNFDCEMCYIRHTPGQVEEKGGLKPLAFWKDVIAQLKELGVLVICLIGGEPFLYPDMEAIYKELVNNGFLVNITTNASLLADGIPNWLRENPPRYVTVSLYGASDETYKVVTGHSKGFSKAIQGVENLLKEGIDVKLNFLATPGNKHDLERIFDIKNRYKLPLLATSYSHPVNRNIDGRGQKRLSAEECALYSMKSHYLENPEGYEEYCKKILSAKPSDILLLHGDHVFCYAGKGTVWVDWQGNIIPCSMLSHVSYSLTEMKAEEAWNILQADVCNIKTCAKCLECGKRGICTVCAGSMYTETGSTSGCPDYLCRVTEETVRIAREYLETSGRS